MSYNKAIKQRYPGIREDQYRLEDNGSGVELKYLDPSIGEKLSKQELQELASTVLDVPKKVTKRQFMLAIFDIGLNDRLNIIIRGKPDRGKIDWDHSHEITRDHSIVATIAQVEKLSERQLDELFIAASLL